MIGSREGKSASNNLIIGSYTTNIRKALMIKSNITERFCSLLERFLICFPSALRFTYSGINGPYTSVFLERKESGIILLSNCLKLLNQVGMNQYVANKTKKAAPHRSIDSVSSTKDTAKIIPTPVAADFKITLRSLLKKLFILFAQHLSHFYSVIISQKSLKVSFILALMLSFSMSFSASASEECLAAISKYEKLYNIPTGLLKAVSKIESEHNHLALNDGLKSHNFKTDKEVLERISYLKNIGKTNFDIGCMQINYYWHNQNFASVEEMLDVTSNVRYAASIIHGLYKAHGSWQAAVRHYHSYEPKFYQIYSKKIALAWLKEK